jgi:hypothetical protein
MAVLFPAMTLGVATPVLAQQPIVHLKFDGSLANSGSNGVQAEAVAPGSRGETPASISYAEGRFGQAGLFDGDVVLRLPVQLDKDQYGQFTFTGWVYTDEDWDAEAPMIGNGSHLWLNIWGRNVQMQCGKHCLIVHAGTGVPPERWVFIAGVWDAANSKATLYLDQRVTSTEEMDLSTLGEASEHLWIGVRDGSNMSMAKSMRFDDFRFYDRTLSASQIAAIRAGASLDSPLTGQPARDGPVLAENTELDPQIGGASDIEKAKTGGESSAESSAPRPAAETTEDPSDDGKRRVIGWRINHDNSYTTELAGRPGDLSRILKVSTPGAGIQRVGWRTDKGMACRMLIDDDSTGTDWEKEAGTCLYVMGSRVANLDGGYITDLYFSPKATLTDGLDQLILTAYRINGQGQLVDELKETTKDIDTHKLPLPLLPPLADPDYQNETSCIRDHVATGLVAHYKRRATNATTIVGLQLICSAVVKLYEE